MSRKCKLYTPNNGPCGDNSVIISNISSDGKSCPVTDRSSLNLSKSSNDKIISDPTGKQNGKGLDRKHESECFCMSLQCKIEVPAHLEGGKNGKISLTVNKNIVKDVQDIFNAIYDETNYIIVKASCYDYRFAKNPNGSSRGNLSNHSFGVAIDINGGHNGYGKNYAHKCSSCGNVGDDNLHIRTENHEVVKIFKRFGWSWLGTTINDYMHFSKFGG